MYPYNFKPSRKGINSREIFIAMPFGETDELELDNVFNDLILPAVEKANQLLGLSTESKLAAYRSEDDMRTASGWINVLEHLTSAQIVLGILTGDNTNVFYELGIAHATQPITRQILIANKGYSPKFDTKDLIYYPYEDDLEKSIEPLAKKIEDAIKWYVVEEEKKVKQAIMQLGPYEFEVIMNHQGAPNFVFHTSREGRRHYEDAMIRNHGEDYGRGSFERHVPAITNLCRIGLLGLNTRATVNQGTTVV